MRVIPRRKSQTQQTVDTIVAWLKLGAVAGAAKGAGKGAQKGVRRAAKKNPAIKRAPILLAAGGAAVLAAVKIRSGGDSTPSPA
jgi:hypothetical protein